MPEWTREQWQLKGIPSSLKLQHYWSLLIRLFSVISKRVVEGVLPLCRDAVGVFYCPSQIGSLSVSAWSIISCYRIEVERYLVIFLSDIGFFMTRYHSLIIPRQQSGDILSVAKRSGYPKHQRSWIFRLEQNSIGLIKLDFMAHQLL